MPTSFPKSANNVSCKVGPGGYTVGSTTLTLRAGDGAKLPALGAGEWLRVSIFRAAVAYSPLAVASDSIVLKGTAVAGDAVTVQASALEGTGTTFSAGDVVELRITAGGVDAIHSAINSVESTAVFSNTSYANPSWITSLAGSKVSGAVLTSGVQTVDGNKTLIAPTIVHVAQDVSQTLISATALFLKQTRADGLDAAFGTGPPGPVGNVVFGIWNTCREGTPYVLPLMISDDGSLSTGQSVQISQMRRTDGSIIGCYGPGSLDIRPDGNWSCARFENTLTGQPNGYCIGFLNRDSGDSRDAANDGPYSIRSGLLQCAIGPSGQVWWGPLLLEDPEANRLAKLWLSTATGNLTFESSVSATTTTVDIWRPSTAGVGSAALAWGRRSDGNADLIVTALSGATGDATITFTTSTSTALRTAMQLLSRVVDGTASAIVKAPILGVGSGIKFTTDNGDGTGTARAAFGTAGNLVVGGVNGNYLLTLTGASRGGVYYGLPAGSSIADGDILNYALVGDASSTATVTGFLYSVNSSAAFTSSFKNTRATSTSAHAIMELSTQSANGGSPFNLYTIAGVRNVCVGIDNADSDKWKVSFGYPIGAGDVFTLTPSGDLAHLGSKVGFNGSTPVAKAASPGTATGTDAAVLNAVVTVLRNLGLAA